MIPFCSSLNSHNKDTLNAWFEEDHVPNVDDDASVEWDGVQSVECKCKHFDVEEADRPF